MRAKVGVSLFRPMRRWHKRITAVLVAMAFLVANVFPVWTLPFFFPAKDAYAAKPVPLAVKYDDFSSETGIQRVKNATVNESGVLMVFPNTGVVGLGAAYTSEKIKLKDQNSFSTYFVFNFDRRIGGGAEGMAFVLQPVANNVEGATTNKFGTGGITPSIAIEFDTFQNTGQAGGATVEPAGHHIAVFKNGDPYSGNIKTATAPAGLNFTDATQYHVWIDYDGLTDNLIVKMGTSNDFNAATQVLQTAVDIASIMGTDEVFAGFSAGSGDYKQDHNVYKWYMRNDSGPIDPARTYCETASLTANLAVISSTESEITYRLKDHLDQQIVGESVYFATTAGTLSLPQGITDANGQVSVRLQSDSAINATVTATTDSGRINHTEVAIGGVSIPGDDDLAQLDADALDYASFIGSNASPFALESNLELPVNGANGSSITWNSSHPAYVTDAGIVTQPAYEEGFQAVQLTATLTNGGASITKAFSLAVKPLDDTTAPSVISSTPAEGATILNDNNKITVTFSETIKVADANQISVTVIDENGSQINARIIKSIHDNVLEIQPVYQMTDADAIKLLIVNDAITDLANNPLENDYELNYTFERTRPNLLTSNVVNMQKSVPVNQSIILKFADETIIDESQISLQHVKRFDGENNEELAVIVNKEPDKLTIRAQNDLLPEEEYRLFIPNEAIVDAVGNTMKTPIDIQFSTTSISEINLLTPLLATDTYIFGDYIKLEFDQLFNAEIAADSWRSQVSSFFSNYTRAEPVENYFTFGKALFIKKDNLTKTWNDGIECYLVQEMKVTSKYNGNCQASFDSSEAVKTKSNKVRLGRGRSYTQNLFYFAANEVNIGSSPLTPAEFGREIETGYVSLDYRQAIAAGNLNLISMENPSGVNPDIRAEINGSRLIVKPAAGQWLPSQKYILKVPQGALENAQGDAIKRFEYPFQTPIKYDYTDTTISIQQSQLAVGGYNYVYGNIRNNRPYRYYSFFDQNRDYTTTLSVSNITTGEEKTVDYTGFVLCDIPGIYEAVLKIIDNGYEYEFRDSFEVVDIDKSLTKLTTRQTGTQTAYDYTQFEDVYKTSALLSNNNMPLGNRNVKIEVFGAKSKHLYYSKNDTTNPGGYANFKVPLDNLPAGKFKVVFSSPETAEKAVYYLVTKRITGSSDLNIFLYDGKTKKLIRNAENFSVSINGNYLPATQLANGTYSVKNVRPGTYDMKIEKEYYISKTLSQELKNGDNKIVYYLKRYIPSSNISVSTPSSDYVSNNYKDAIFIDGIDADITFTANPNWNGHEPGQVIYEFYKGNKSRQFPSNDGKLTVNVGNLLGPGTRGRVYAVSKDGTVSSKQDMKMEVASKPSYCYASFSDSKKQYFLNYNFNLESVGSAQVPNDWPLIGGDQFAIDVGKFQLGGVMDPYGKIDFAIGLSKLEFENAQVMSNYKKLVKNYKAGKFGDDDSELAFSFDTNQVWQYDITKDMWSYEHGDYTLYLEGEVSYTQYFMVVVVPAYLKGVLGVEADAKLNVDVLINKKTSSETFKYTGQIDAAPSIEIIVGAGVSGLNVEGFLNGKIETSMTIPEFDFAADGQVGGGVRANALLWTWEKNAIEYSWTIAARQRALLASTSILPGCFALLPDDNGFNPEDIKQSDFKLLPRHNADSNIWIGNQSLLRLLRAPEKISNSVLLQDVPDFTNTGLTAIGSNLFLVWAEDNPVKTAGNRTELKYAIYDGISWTEGSFFNQDDTADFKPVVAGTSNGAVIAWQDLKRLVEENEAIDDYLAACELSAAEYSNGILTGKTTLTDDDYYDCMPAIACSDGKTHLAWVKNKSNNILSPAAGSFEILYAVNDGSGWSTPIVLETGLNQIADLDIAAHGSEVTVVYNLDADGNIFTSRDWEVYAKQASDGTWSPAARLTSDEIQDSNVRAFYKNNEATVIWLQNGILSEMSIQDQIFTPINDISAQAFEIAQSANDIQVLTYITGMQDGQQDIKTIFYDGHVQQWSKPVKITGNNCVNSEVAAAVTANNEMTVIHKTIEKIVEEIEGVQYANVGAANIEAHKMTLTKDLKVVENTINFTDGFITDGENQINATIENCGEFTVNNFEVAFYDGLGNQIALAAVQTPLLPGEKTIVSASWIAPETIGDPNITVTVDPADTIADFDRSNNTVTEEVLKSDVSIESYATHPIDHNNYLLEMTLANYSSLAAEDLDINFYHNDSLINTQTLPTIDAGLTEDVVMELNTAALFGTTNLVEGQIDIDVKGTFADADDDNDRLTIEFNQVNIQIDASNIDDGSSGVPTDMQIELEFSDKINSGTGYNNIKLVDFASNPVPITKEITESRMLIKPISLLSKGTYYSLTVPVQSLVTDYAQTMERDYNLSFITDTSNVSVVGSYPANNAVEIPATDNITVQFNKPVLEGPEFAQIALIQAGTGLGVAASTTIADHQIMIDPVYPLQNGTVYYVFIPAYAVMDTTDEILESDYEFSFTTEGEYSGGIIGGGADGYTSSEPPEVKTDSTAASIIGMDTVNNTETAFMAQLSSETTSFSITAELVRAMQEQNKPLLIEWDDITLTIQGLSDTSPLDFTILRQQVTDGLTHENDKVLSNLYRVSVQRDQNNPGSVKLTPSPDTSGLPAYRLFASLSSLMGEDLLMGFNEQESGDLLQEDGLSNSMNGQWQVTIPVDLEKINHPKKCAVFYQEDNGQWQPAGGVIDAAAQTMQFTLNTNLPFVVVERDITFEDIQNRWSTEAIEVLTAQGIISGKSKKQFDPLGDITRAEFTTLIVKSLFAGTAEYQNEFNDIKANDWYADYIAKAVKLGLVSGIGNGQFAPNNRITREQMIVILDKLNQFKGGSADNAPNLPTGSAQKTPFADLATASDYAQEAIIRMADMSIIKGYNGKVMPKNNASREEAAMMIYKMIENG